LVISVEDMSLANNEKLTYICYYSCGDYFFKNIKKKTVTNEEYFKKYIIGSF
jgi:hypothetical protein